MKHTNQILTITLTLAFSAAAYFQPLFLIPAVIFSLVLAAYLVARMIAPDIAAAKQIEKRLDAMDETLRKLKLSRLG